MDTEITVVRGWREVNELKEALATTPLVALDTETTSVPWYDPDHKLLVVAISTRPGHAYVIPVDHAEASGFPALSHIFGPEESQPIWLMQNGMFDLLVLRQAGISLRTPWEDTLTAQYVLDVEAPKSLTALVQRYLGLPPWKDIDYKHPEEESLDVLGRLCGRDADATLRVWQRLSHEIYSNHNALLIYRELLQPASTALCEMEWNGVQVDLDRLQDLTERTEDEIERLTDAIREYADNDNFNPNSTQQLGKLLFGKLGLPVTDFTATGAPSTNKSALHKLRDVHPIIPLIQAYRKERKLLTASLVPWGAITSSSGRPLLHPRYKPAFVRTGRLSSEGPNIQQVPRRTDVRRLFVAPEGYDVVEIDYSQLELRIVAWVAGEDRMLEAYASGADLHQVTADALGVGRHTGKTANFGLLYGAGYRKLRQIAEEDYGLELTDLEAQAIREQWLQAYPAIGRYHEAAVEEARDHGQIETPFGRVRRLPEIHSSEWGLKGNAERQAINTPIQSTASDLTLLMLTEFINDPVLKAADVRPVLTVHDSIIFYVPTDDTETVSYIADRMENPPTEKTFGVKLGVPLVADIKRGPSWGEANEI